ncbi:MAG: DNA-formamidopyrimidine glycosylase [Bacilli bacterium]
MPELPEVETVRQVLSSLIIKATITDVEILKERIVTTPLDQFKSRLIGATFERIDRIGKYLIFYFDRDLILVSHLRMEGKYIEILPGETLSRFARVVFTLKDGRKLCYDDSRQFGTMTLIESHELASLKGLTKLGPEPFEAETQEVYQRFLKSSRPVKELLLDQTVMTGLGNIYADEVLFLSSLHPQYPANKVSKDKVEEIIKHAITVLNQAIMAGGSTIRTYHPGNGITGDFQTHLNVYGRQYQPCFICGHKLKKIFVGGRGSTYCPHCQRRVDAPLLIAITGLIGAGKSTVGSHLKSRGHKVYDADLIVRELYRDKKVTKSLEKKLNVVLHHKGSFQRELLKEALVIDVKLIKKVEDFIHPLVKEKMIEIIKNSDDKVIFCEVPLVFSHKIYELFDYIIGVETDKATQEKFLLARGKTVIVTPDQQYIKNRIKLDKIIINNGSIKKLYHDVDKVLIALDIK